MREYILTLTFLLVVFFVTTVSGREFWLDELDISKVHEGYCSSKRNLSIDGNALNINGKAYTRGLGSHATGGFRVNLFGEAISFSGSAGVDYEVSGKPASIAFRILVDGKEVWKSDSMSPEDDAIPFNVDLIDADQMVMEFNDTGDGIAFDHADVVNAKFDFKAKRKPELTMFLDNSRYILTPPPPATPRINGAKVIGVRPGSPFHFLIPATGKEPLNYSTVDLPDTLKINSSTGLITGTTPSKRGTYKVNFKVRNSLGSDERQIRIVVGDTLALTPPMGWNSWYSYSESLSEQGMRDTAKAMIAKGLHRHGWTYVNMDDTWQGERGGPLNALLPNDKFNDMAGMCDYIHSLGLKVGIYHTPWVGTYAGFIGGSAKNSKGEYHSDYRPLDINSGPRFQFNQFFGRYPGALNLGLDVVGEHWFCDIDAEQWEQWGFDYVKYDWLPNDVATTKRIKKGLDKIKRNIHYSLSNNAPFANAAGLSKIANSWRTTGDIHASWGSVSGIGFHQDQWAPFSGPGHWNDMDILQLGNLGIPNRPNLTFVPTALTPDEQFSHMSLWCLQCSPLLLSGDVSSLDAFTLSLLTNDEVLEVNQDPLGVQATKVFNDGVRTIYSKKMEDGDLAVGLFNRDSISLKIELDFNKHLGRNRKVKIRDLWRQKDLGTFQDSITFDIPSHGVRLLRIQEVESVMPEE